MVYRVETGIFLLRLCKVILENHLRGGSPGECHIRVSHSHNFVMIHHIFGGLLATAPLGHRVGGNRRHSVLLHDGHRRHFLRFLSNLFIFQRCPHPDSIYSPSPKIWERGGDAKALYILLLNT